MKTKIIYISGSEIFDVADIRSAFEEVRNALGFGTDTVLFGVPVDADDAGLKIQENTEKPESDIELGCDEVISEPQEIIIEEEPVKKKSQKTRAKSIPDEEIKKTEEKTEKIIPILSVLSSKQENSEPQEQESETIQSETIQIESVTLETITFENTKFDELIASETLTIEEMISDDSPMMHQEKTLEQLFEKIAPLREDIIVEETVNKQTNSYKEELNLDATLEQLATEFVEKEDEIISVPRAETSGKIGKLKNILPFKKAKREEPSLMGDLFGWAGIAANDDEFSIPGFFTTSASKK